MRDRDVLSCGIFGLGTTVVEINIARLRVSDRVSIPRQKMKPRARRILEPRARVYIIVVGGS